MLSELNKFIGCCIDKSRPVLLGLSGGPDSLALLHLLNESPLIFGVAHVDHGWRAESGDEAEVLKEMVGNVPFHLKKLEMNEIGGNLEDCCRRERHAFFRDLCQEYGYQGVILGHHRDDQSETVLKRIFEGASLTRLGAMKPKVEIDGLTIFRPLLGVTKKEILRFVEKRGLTPFDDTTNRDTRFLRARFRQEMVPYLNSQFGKNIAPSLARLAIDSQEIENYLDRKISAYRLGEGGVLDLSQGFPSERVELRHLLRRVYPGLSREQYDTLCVLIEEGATDRCVMTGSQQVVVDRRRVYVVPLK